MYTIVEFDPLVYLGRGGFLQGLPIDCLFLHGESSRTQLTHVDKIVQMSELYRNTY